MRALSVLLSAVTLLPLLTRAAFHSNNTACTRHYTVQPGDTCDKIGQKTLTSTYQILAFNLLDAGADCYTLEIGSRLCLGRYGNDCQFVHQCSEQDTCESIANAYSITTEHLQSNNPSLDCDVVYQGLMLCVSAGSIRPPADSSINATDVKAAREKARQMWLTKQIANDHFSAPHSTKATKQIANDHFSAPHSTKATKQIANDHFSAPHSTKATKHSSHPSHADKHHQHAPTAKSNHKSSAHNADSLPQAVVEKSPSPKQRWPPRESHQAPSSSSAQDLEVLVIDDLYNSAPLGSNHTPNHQDQQPPLAGTHPTSHRRHRSLSSRSYHQRSHTP